MWLATDSNGKSVLLSEDESKEINRIRDCQRDSMTAPHHVLCYSQTQDGGMMEYSFPISSATQQRRLEQLTPLLKEELERNAQLLAKWSSLGVKRFLTEQMGKVSQLESKENKTGKVLAPQPKHVSRLVFSLITQQVASLEARFDVREFHQASFDALLLGQSQQGEAWKDFAQYWFTMSSIQKSHPRELISAEMNLFYHGTDIESAAWIAHRQKFNPCYSVMAVHGKGCYVSRDPMVARRYAQYFAERKRALVVFVGFLGRHHKKSKLSYSSSELTYDEEEDVSMKTSNYPLIIEDWKDTKDSKDLKDSGEPETTEEILLREESKLSQMWSKVALPSQQQYLEQTCDSILPRADEDMVCVRNPSVMFPVCVLLLK